MDDLSAQLLEQQSHARPISGEELEAYGRKSASAWELGEFKTMTDAVVGTVKSAGLSPEQVRRVVEFANTSAYLNEFRKEGQPHKVINFEGGPADPGDVLRDLNDGGGGSVFDRGTLDYRSPPVASKTASVDAEQELLDLFKTSGREYPSDPLREVLDLKEKVASAYEHHSAELSGLETMYQDISAALYHQVKQAALSGYGLGQVVRAWGSVADDPEYVKAAFAFVVPRLVKEGIFRSAVQLDASMQKTGSAGIVNREHPLVDTFQDYCSVLYKLAEVRQAENEAGAALGQLSTFVREFCKEKTAFVDPLTLGLGSVALGGTALAAKKIMANRAAAKAVKELAERQATNPGLIHDITNLAREMSTPAQSFGRSAGELLFGQGSPTAASIGNLSASAVKYAPHMAAGYGLYRLAKSPTGQKVTDTVFGSDQPEYLQGYPGY